MASSASDVGAFASAMTAEHLLELIDGMSISALRSLPPNTMGKALREAAQVGATHLVQKLLSAGSPVDTWDAQGRTALIYAAMKSDVATMEMLLDGGANMVWVDMVSKCALSYAVEKDCVGAIDVLLAAGADLSDDRVARDMLCAALRSHSQRALKKLVEEAGAAVLYNGEALVTAVEFHNIDGVRALLSAGANPNSANERSMSAVSSASLHDEPELLKLLLDAGADADHGHSIALITAALARKKKTMDMLLTRGANPNVMFKTGRGASEMLVLLSFVIDLGHVDIAKSLIRAGASANKKGLKGWTSLHHAVKLGDVDLVDMLLGFGAKIDHVDREGCTPLMIACKHAKPGVVQRLLVAKATVNAKCCLGKTALHYAIGGGESNQNTVALLLQAGAGEDVNTADTEGFTALMHAAKHGHVECVSMLLEAGANPSLINSTINPPQVVNILHNQDLITAMLINVTSMQ